MTAAAENLPEAPCHGAPCAGNTVTGTLAAAGCSTSLPVLASDALLQGQAAVLIEHLGQRYRLQATRQGKLILTK